MDLEEALQRHGLSWKDVARDAAAYVGEAEATVAQWEWVRRGDVFWEPPAPRVGREAPLDPLDAEPSAAQRFEHTQIGRDADGAIVVLRHFTDHWEGPEGGTQHGVVAGDVIRHGDLFLRFHHTRHGRDLHEVVLWSFVEWDEDDDGHVLQTRTYRRALHEQDELGLVRYTWHDGRVEAVVSHRVSLAGDGARHERHRSREDLEYDEQGLVRVRWTTELSALAECVGDSGVGWVRRSPGRLRKARQVVDQQLAERIQRWARRVAPDEPVFALALVWSFDAPGLPPSLALGTVAELERFKAASVDPAGRAFDVFSPDEYAIFDPVPAELDDEQLQDAFALLNDDWRMREDDREPQVTLRRIAKRLVASDWSGVLQQGPDFVVFVVSDEPDDTLRRQLRRTIPPDALERLLS